MEIKEQLNKDISKLAAIKDFEARLIGLLDKIRSESLEKLKFYEYKLSKLMAVILHHQSRSESAERVLADLCMELQMVITEKVDDDSRYALRSRNVDSAEQPGTHASDSGASGKPDGAI
jgi:hypothetical protein